LEVSERGGCEGDTTKDVYLLVLSQTGFGGGDGEFLGHMRTTC